MSITYLRVIPFEILRGAEWKIKLKADRPLRAALAAK